MTTIKVINDKLNSLEEEKFYYDNVSVEFTEHFKERLLERIEYNAMCDFVKSAKELTSKLAEKVFLSVTREYRVYYKLIKSYIIIRFDAFKKHITFVTLFPLNGERLETKYTNMQQLLISV